MGQRNATAQLTLTWAQERALLCALTRPTEVTQADMEILNALARKLDDRHRVWRRKFGTVT